MCRLSAYDVDERVFGAGGQIGAAVREADGANRRLEQLERAQADELVERPETDERIGAACGHEIAALCDAVDVGRVRAQRAQVLHVGVARHFDRAVARRQIEERAALVPHDFVDLRPPQKTQIESRSCEGERTGRRAVRTSNRKRVDETTLNLRTSMNEIKSSLLPTATSVPCLFQSMLMFSPLVGTDCTLLDAACRQRSEARAPTHARTHARTAIVPKLHGFVARRRRQLKRLRRMPNELVDAAVVAFEHNLAPLRARATTKGAQRETSESATQHATNATMLRR